MTASLKTLDDLFVHELQDLHNAEKQLVKALPKMAKAANCEKLQQGFEDHLAQTEQHVERLEKIFEQLEKKVGRTKCDAMAGLVEEGQKMIDQDAEPAVKDAGLIAAAQRVEHYEIAAYGSAVAFAKILGLDKAVDLLEQTLAEEKETDEKLTELATSEVNEAAQHVTS
jgi:ferritin-like metal-binding protein YciE